MIMKFACPNCESSDLAKHGKDAGRQKFRCRVCGRQFLGESKFRLDSKTRNVINNLLMAGVSPNIIVLAIPEVSLRYVYKLRKKIHGGDSGTVCKGNSKAASSLESGKE